MLNHKNNYFLGLAEFDRYNRLSPSGVLGILQNISAEHAEILGIGFEDMLKKNLLWVILRTKYTVENQAKALTEIKAETVLLKPGRASSVRNYRIYDNNNRLLIRAETQWAVINKQTRRLMPLSGIMPAAYEYEKSPEFPEGISKLKDFEASGEPYTVCPGFSFTDRNGHINNARCAELAADAINPKSNEVIKSFQIDFIHEAVPGEELLLYTSRNQNICCIKAEGKDNKLRFICKTKFCETIS